MVGRLPRRICGRRNFYVVNFCIIVFLIIILCVNHPSTEKKHLPTEEKHQPTQSVEPQFRYEDFIRWNRSLCSMRSDNRGPHQKIIALSVYGSASKYTDNPMYSWEKSILPFLRPLVHEVTELLPSWIIRVYIDFTGSTQPQRDALSNFSNIDVCDVHDLPMFGSSILTYLPGKMWRFLPIFDPLVDYVLSRDLDSPMLRRETETLDMWLTPEQEKYYFLSLRDNIEHGIPILGGLWGASPGRARRHLYNVFRPILVPPIARKYNGTGDQVFLGDLVWRKVKNNALVFDSYHCEQFGGRPFLSQRPVGNCYLGCIRTCCTNSTDTQSNRNPKPCPIACRPKDHQDWIYC